MNGSTIIFYLLSGITIGSAVLSVTSRQIFRSAIYLLFSLIGIAGIYFWLNYQFIAAVQIVVYVGGIVVLIIFSIFLTQQAGDQLPRQKIGRTVFSALAVFSGFALTMVQLMQHSFTGTAAPPMNVSVRNIGTQLLSLDETGYALPFEVVSMLLLASMIGCIVIAMRTPSENKNETLPVEKPNIEVIVIKDTVLKSEEESKS